jgi:hypothetical protein
MTEQAVPGVQEPSTTGHHDDEEGSMRTFTISEALLDELKDYFENRQDVRDGSYGEQVANEEMSLLLRLEEDCRPLPESSATGRS